MVTVAVSSSAGGLREALGARRIVAATIGNALEFYDFITYAFFAVQIGRTFFPSGSAFMSLMLSLATFGAGFATRPLGGLVLGLYADRVGRRAAMLLSFALMGGAILALALVPSYAAIGIAAPILAIVARLVQGFALGGEVGSTTAYLMEAAPAEHRALAVSWQSVSQNLAASGGALVGFVLSLTLSGAALDAYGWRIAFLIGALALPFGLVMRRALPETLHEPEAASTAAEKLPWRLVVLSVLVLGGGTISTYITNYMATYAQTSLHLSAATGMLGELANNMMCAAGALLGGWMADRHGRRPVMIWPNLLFLIAIVPCFWWITHSAGSFAFLSSNLGLGMLNGITYAAFYAALIEGLPKPIRGRSFALIYAIAIASFGGTTQPMVAWLIHATGSNMAIAWYLAGSTAIGTLAMLLIDETAPIVLARRMVLAAHGAK